MKKKELHVVYIITKLELGGAQKVCLSLFEGLRQSGHIPLLISGKAGVLAQHVEHYPHVYLLPTMHREVSRKALINELKNIFCLISSLKKLKKEFPHLMVHTHSTKAGLIGRWAAFFAGIKNRIHTIHGFAFHAHQPRLIAFIIYFLELITSFITTHFICVSSTDVQTGVRFFPFFKHNYSIIRAAVECSFAKAAEHRWQPSSIAKDSEEQIGTQQQNPYPFIIGTVACFKEQKNLPDLIHAFHEAYHYNNQLRLEIIGDGVLRPELEKLIADYNLQEIITLHGWQHNVASLMKNWNLFALTSLWEGLPCSLVEARILKLPVLSYNTGGIHDVIISGKNGFLYDQKDWKSLAKGILELSHDNNLYTKLCDYNDDLHDFKNKTMVEKHIQLYEML